MTLRREDEKITDDGIESIVSLIEVAEVLGKAIGLTTPMAARAILKGAQLMTSLNEAGRPSLLKLKLVNDETKH